MFPEYVTKSIPGDGIRQVRAIIQPLRKNTKQLYQAGNFAHRGLGTEAGKKSSLKRQNALKAAKRVQKEIKELMASTGGQHHETEEVMDCRTFQLLLTRTPDKKLYTALKDIVA